MISIDFCLLDACSKMKYTAFWYHIRRTAFCILMFSCMFTGFLIILVSFCVQKIVLYQSVNLLDDNIIMSLHYFLSNPMSLNAVINSKGLMIVVWSIFVCIVRGNIGFNTFTQIVATKCIMITWRSFSHCQL